MRSRQRRNGLLGRRDLHESRPDPPRLGMEGGARACGGARRPEQSRLTLPEDSGLLARDVLERGAENVEMVGGDVRYDRDLGRKDVRRIEPSSDPDFHDGHPDARAAKQLECRDRERLEVRGSALARSRDRSHESKDFIERGGDDIAVRKSHALRHGDEVRRRVKPAGDVRCGEDRGDDSGGRALAVGPADQDRLKGRLGISERRQEGTRPTEARAHFLGTERLEPRQTGEQCSSSAQIEGPSAAINSSARDGARVRPSHVSRRAARRCPRSRAPAGTRTSGSLRAESGGSSAR